MLKKCNYKKPAITIKSKLQANEGGCCATSCGGSPMAPPNPKTSLVMKKLNQTI